MLCQNCGKNEANIKYTQVINGLKKEIELCEECAQKIGIDGLGMPDLAMDLHSILGDFFSDYAENTFIPTLGNRVTKCKNCGMTYDEFIKNGLFGCSECYNTFSRPIESLLKNLHGTAKHIGRENNGKSNNIEYTKSSENITSDDKKYNQKEKIQKELEIAIKEERYEDAAKLRDKLKEMNK